MTNCSHIATRLCGLLPWTKGRSETRSAPRCASGSADRPELVRALHGPARPISSTTSDTTAVRQSRGRYTRSPPRCPAPSGPSPGPHHRPLRVRGDPRSQRLWTAATPRPTTGSPAWAGCGASARSPVPPDPHSARRPSRVRPWAAYRRRPSTQTLGLRRPPSVTLHRSRHRRDTVTL